MVTLFIDYSLTYFLTFKMLGPANVSDISVEKRLKRLKLGFVIKHETLWKQLCSALPSEQSQKP